MAAAPRCLITAHCTSEQIGHCSTQSALSRSLVTQLSVEQVSAGSSVSQYEDGESGIALQISTMADGEVADDEHSKMSEVPGDNGEASEPDPDGSAPLTPTRCATGWLLGWSVGQLVVSLVSRSVSVVGQSVS